MGKILRLELDSFKSYQGYQVIGPFENFTAIIGPTGSGKSNLMDAICFVLGVRPRELRGETPQDLIYGAGKGENKSALVTLVYDNHTPTSSTTSEQEEEEEEPTRDDEIHFTRTINEKGTSTYSIQGKTVSYNEYDSKLRSLGIHVKARNCLVFQGDVDSIATKSPKDLTKFFEDISSSGELVEEYERLRVEKEEAEASSLFAIAQKKGMSLEKKQAKEQKEEAEKYHAKLKELDTLKTERYLWELFHIESDVDIHSKRMNELKESLTMIQAREKSLEERLESEKTLVATKHKACVVSEKAVAKARSALSKHEPNAIKAKEAVNMLKKKLKEAKEEEKQAKSELEKQASEVSSLERDIANLTSAEKEIQEKMKSGEYSSSSSRSPTSGKKVNLSEEERTELEQLREKAREKTVSARAELTTLQREQDTDKERLSLLERNLSQLNSQQSDLEAEKDDLLKRKTKMTESLNALKEHVKECEAALANSRQNKEKINARIKQLEAKLQETQNTLKLAKAVKADSKKELARTELLESLKRHFPGVHGRLVDLCQPSSKKFSVAVSTAMGKHMDAIVVDKESTGMECIKYLRDQRAGTATFLPLETLQVQRPSERYRQLGPMYRLAMDVLEYDKSIERAVLYAIGGVVICDTLEDARTLCFERDVRVKAVTLEGHIIAKNGDMTGGTTDAESEKADRFQQRELENLRQLRENLEKELADIQSGKISPDILGKTITISNSKNDMELKSDKEVEMTLSNLTNRIKFAEMDLKVADEKISKCNKELSDIEQELKRNRPGYQTLQGIISVRETSIDEMKSKINSIDDAVFSEFGAKIGIANIREFERRELEQRSEISEKLGKVREQIGKLEAQLRYVQSRNRKEALETTQKSIESLAEKLEKKQAEEISSSESLKVLSTELEKAEAEYSSCKSAVEESRLVVKEATKAHDAVLKEKAELTRSITAEETMIEKIQSQKRETIQKARLERVDLPRLSVDSLTSTSSSNSDETDSSSEDQSTTKDKSKGMEIDDSDADLSEEAKVPKFDFSLLKLSSRNKQKSLNEKEREHVISEYLSKIQALQDEVEKMQPNMRAGDRFADVSERLKKTDQKLQEVSELAETATRKFEKIKTGRYDRFKTMFDHVSNCIDATYKELTRSEKHPQGGSAYLELESNTDEPYLHGIKFYAMPPTKRFRSMEQLSGGEKTVAALALLFAIDSFNKAPFFVMDEMDAALDNINIAKVSNYIRRRAAAQDMQFLIISHKDSFYYKADSLVGVYQTKDEDRKQKKSTNTSTRTRSSAASTAASDNIIRSNELANIFSKTLTLSLAPFSN